MLVQQEKQAAFGLLAAGIAHEVGNPLAAISSLVQLMNRRELDDYMHEKLGLIDEQLLRIQRTLRELVEFSRPGSTDVSDCSIHDIVDSALSIAKYYKRKKGKTIQLHLAERLPPIRVIRDRVLQVVLNLILNALDATEEGANIHISADHVDGFIEVVVRDSGSGIALEDQKRIFLPYFTTKPTGTGLGLFVCRKILIEAGGEIELLESSSQGTAFRITLPVADPAPDEAEEQLQSASR